MGERTSAPHGPRYHRYRLTDVFCLELDGQALNQTTLIIDFSIPLTDLVNRDNNMKNEALVATNDTA